MGTAAVNKWFLLIRGIFQESHRHEEDLIIWPRSNAGAPVVSEIDGSHQFESRRGSLFWRLEVIDEQSSTGNLVFTTGSANPENFFPIRVSFYSPKIISDISVSKHIISVTFSAFIYR